MLPEKSLAPGSAVWPVGVSLRNAFEVPNTSNPVRASNVIGSQTVPPPCFHQFGPDQVLAATSTDLLSNPFAGSPGTVQKRHSSLPVCASNAAIDPRTCESAPLCPRKTLPRALRGAPVTPACEGSQTRACQSSVPFSASIASRRQSPVPT